MAGRRARRRDAGLVARMLLVLALLAATCGAIAAGFVWLFLWPIGALLWGWGSLLTLAVSRYREYTADAGSALATGRPAALMSALQKLSGEVGLIPSEDLRAVASLEPLFIVPVNPRRLELFADHPPLAKRLARLATIAREMGRPTP